VAIVYHAPPRWISNTVLPEFIFGYLIPIGLLSAIGLLRLDQIGLASLVILHLNWRRRDPPFAGSS
jgi:hypothetical protein